MFVDKKLSIEVMEDLLAVNTIINSSLLKAKERGTAAEFAAYRKIIKGTISVTYDVFVELWHAHPDICPKEFLPIDGSPLKVAAPQKPSKRKR